MSIATVLDETVKLRRGRVPADLKRCKECGTVKPLDEYKASKGSGQRPYCKKCDHDPAGAQFGAVDVARYVGRDARG